MKFLLDTNIVIPLEPTTESEYEDTTRTAFEFQNAANRLRQEVFVHPHIRHDIERDKDEKRKKHRLLTLRRYNEIPDVPDLLEQIASKWPEPEHSNCWVDNHLLSCVFLGICDYLVTEDAGIHKKARHLGVGVCAIVS